MANVYFLLISFMQMIPVISISEGKPAMLFPLIFVILVSMIKDIFEDNKRHKQDNSENYQKVLVFDTKKQAFTSKIWKKVQVGDIVKIMNDEFFPADLVLVQSAGAKGICYVETKNLDGETNLKHKVAEKHLNKSLT